MVMSIQVDNYKQ